MFTQDHLNWTSEPCPDCQRSAAHWLDDSAILIFNSTTVFFHRPFHFTAHQ